MYMCRLANPCLDYYSHGTVVEMRGGTRNKPITSPQSCIYIVHVLNGRHECTCRAVHYTLSKTKSPFSIDHNGSKGSTVQEVCILCVYMNSSLWCMRRDPN